MMSDPFASLDPMAETEYDKLEDVGDRFTKNYDDVFLPDGELVGPVSVLDDPS